MKKRIAELEGALAIAEDTGTTLQAQLKKEKDGSTALRREVSDLASTRDSLESALREAESREKKEKARLREVERALTESTSDGKSALGMQVKENAELKEELAVARGVAKVKPPPHCRALLCCTFIPPCA
jgi:chromosome segregation ATPase